MRRASHLLFVPVYKGSDSFTIKVRRIAPPVDLCERDGRFG